MAPNSGSGWTVEYQSPALDVGPDNRVVQGVRVGFVTAKGIHSFVFIPRDRFNPQAVKEAIAGWVAVHDAVADLKG